MKIVDMHCDTIYKLPEYHRSAHRENLRSNSGHLDLNRMSKSKYLLQNFAIFVHLGECEDPWECFLMLFNLYQEEMKKNQDIILPAYTYEDIINNERNGKMSALLTIEEGGVCKGELEKLHSVYDKGVRMITLTWNYPNELGFPNYNKLKTYTTEPSEFLTKEIPDTENGLTEKGRIFLEEMENLGIIPDVSHLSDAGFYDVLGCTKKPFVASHSNARAVCNSVRNLSDQMIKALADRGGITGLNYQSIFLLPKDENGKRKPATIKSIVDHAKHIVNVGGIEVLGLGSDFDGITTHEELQGVQNMEKLYDALIKAGFSSSQTDKIFYENVLRVYKEVLN